MEVYVYVIYNRICGNVVFGFKWIFKFFFCRFLKFYFICSFVYDVLVWKLFIFGIVKRIL